MLNNVSQYLTKVRFLKIKICMHQYFIYKIKQKTDYVLFYKLKQKVIMKRNNIVVEYKSRI